MTVIHLMGMGVPSVGKTPALSGTMLQGVYVLGGRQAAQAVTL